MTTVAPFPYFGGKRRAAPIIWQALGDTTTRPGNSMTAVDAKALYANETAGRGDWDGLPIEAQRRYEAYARFMRNRIALQINPNLTNTTLGAEK